MRSKEPKLDTRLRECVKGKEAKAVEWQFGKSGGWRPAGGGSVGNGGTSSTESVVVTSPLCQTRGTEYEICAADPI